MPPTKNALKVSKIIAKLINILILANNFIKYITKLFII